MIKQHLCETVLSVEAHNAPNQVITINDNYSLC